MVAYSIEDSVSRNCRHQLLGEEREKNPTDYGQNQIMHHEEAIELEWFPIFHEFSPGKDRHVVGHEHCHRCCQSREGRCAWYENEVVCRVPHDAGIELVELRP